MISLFLKDSSKNNAHYQLIIKHIEQNIAILK